MSIFFDYSTKAEDFKRALFVRDSMLIIKINLGLYWTLKIKKKKEGKDMLTQTMNSVDIFPMGLRELLEMEPEQIVGDLSKEAIYHILKTCGAFWFYQGDPRPELPHAELPSGMCSDSCVDLSQVLQYPNICRIMAYQMVRRCAKKKGSSPISWSVGSDRGGTILSYEVAAQLGSKHGFTKDIGGSQVWGAGPFIKSNEVAVQVEGLIVDTSTLRNVRNAIQRINSAEVTFAPFSLALIRRSEVPMFQGYEIISLLHCKMNTWHPSECPLCKVGSKSLSSTQDREELVGK